jgi:hypothetical protein
MEGEKIDSHGKVLKNVFSSQNIAFPFFKRGRLLELLFIFLILFFSMLLFLSFFMVHLFIDDELGDFLNV